MARGAQLKTSNFHLHNKAHRAEGKNSPQKSAKQVSECKSLALSSCFCAYLEQPHIAAREEKNSNCQRELFMSGHPRRRKIFY
jgi:hypothetical protein